MPGVVRARCRGRAGVGCATRRYEVPLRPPVPPQRHDCPQLCTAAPGDTTARSYVRLPRRRPRPPGCQTPTGSPAAAAISASATTPVTRRSFFMGPSSES
ncbi:hypothetical protein Sipo8835_15900 [Streptomyces ipomoeae]|uniref:Uncharacterized protein n=1 Tax=Streptomyces ipomoeae TaxID=103232 RepID=A0AAE8W417_9ACTN|nr:hypothetical protein Sipo8835_15900 [Streptomyces ipomoeae]TQE39376.1 hypothetical protein Sipo7851_03900 [Streptomyces ipomoeae]